MANEGKVSYFEFVKYIKKILSSKSKVKPVKDKHFKSEGFKPLKTSLISIRKNKMRNWKKAINEYLETKKMKKLFKNKNFCSICSSKNLKRLIELKKFSDWNICEKKLKKLSLLF